MRVGEGLFFKSLMSKWSKQLEKVSCDVHEDQMDTKSSTERGLKVKELFDLESDNNREARRENRGTLLFPRAGVQPAENPSGSAPMNKMQSAAEIVAKEDLH